MKLFVLLWSPGWDISDTPIMVYDNGMKMLLNDTVSKKLTYLKNIHTVLY